MHHAPDALGGFPIERGVPAAIAHARRDALYDHKLLAEVKHLLHLLPAEGGAAADIALGHFCLRLPKSIHSSGDGS